MASAGIQKLRLMISLLQVWSRATELLPAADERGCESSFSDGGGHKWVAAFDHQEFLGNAVYL
jgi:hypothetical protein